MTKRAVIYARVSGDDRGNDGRNLDDQLKVGREYAEGKGYEVVEQLPEDDKGASGAEIDLPKLNRVRDMARAKQFDVLIVREIDRLSRNLAKQLIVESELKRAGVSIEYVIGEYPETPEGNFMKHVRASVAEFEREKIRERMLRGRKLKAKAGKWAGHCQPFGYRRIGSGKEAELAIDEKEAAIVQQIFRWFITEKVSLRQIASRLTAAQAPVPGADYGKPGVVWSSTTIRRMLRNTSYLGKFRYMGYEINLPEMAIISEEDFNRVQEKLAGHKSWRQRGRRATPGRYLLLGHLFCSCGYRMTGKTMHKAARYIYYGCVTSAYPKEKHPCSERVRRELVEGIVWEWLTAVVSMDETRLRRGLEQIASEREDQLQARRERIETITAEIAGIERRIGGLIRAFSGDEDDTVVETLRAQVKAQTKQKADLLAQREMIAAELEQCAVSGGQIQSIVEFAGRLRSKMNNATYEQKRELLELLNVRIDLARDGDDRLLKMSCDLPDSDYAQIIRRTDKSPRRNSALLSSPSWPAATPPARRFFLPARPAI